MIVCRQKNGMKSWSIGPRVFDSEENIKGPCNAPIVGRWKMESGFMQMVVADTMKKRPFIAILCMHKMQTRAISLGYGGFYHCSIVFFTVRENFIRFFLCYDDALK